MKSIRKRFTYANVMSSIAVFLVLGGATAFAAHQLGRRSVGTKQLKSNAVTTAKLKRNAVTKPKIKKGAVDSAKIADGSVTGTDIDTPSTPFARVVARMRTGSAVAVTESLQVYPLAPNTFTQAPDEVDGFPGAVDVTFARKLHGATQRRGVGDGRRGRSDKTDRERPGRPWGDRG